MVDREAYARCLRLAREHYENFPVASWLLPAESRRHVAAIYAFARAADDFADEGARTPDERLALLEGWRARLFDASPAADGSDADLVFRAVHQTIQTCHLETSLFEDLLSAFRQDVTTTRYETWDDVLDYCRRSANPVGRLVLRVTGYRSETLDRHADAICTALQLTNFWQDLARDWSKGRLYVPMAMMREARAETTDLTRGEISPEWRVVLEELARRTRAYFMSGEPLTRLIKGRLGWELRATWLGGVRILDRLERARFDVFTHRPSLGWRDAAGIGWRLVRGR